MPKSANIAALSIALLSLQFSLILTTQASDENTLPPSDETTLQIHVEKTQKINPPEAPTEETLSAKNLLFSGSAKYYITPQGRKLADRRKTGPLYPTAFDLVKNDGSFEYIVNGNDEKGCDLETTFQRTIYKKYGFDIRRYFNAISTPTEKCFDLPSVEEKTLCEYYHNNQECLSGIPLGIYVNPLPMGANYLTYGRENFLGCKPIIEAISLYNTVPKQSEQWQKIQGDLIEKKRQALSKQLQANPPLQEIKASLIAAGQATDERSLKFAAREYAYNQSVNAPFVIDDKEVDLLAPERYSPAAAITSLISFKAQAAKSCPSDKYNSKIFGEALNIPAHQILQFNDLADRRNKCICP